MGGNGHFQMNGAQGPVADKRKPNSTGADYTAARVNDVLKTMYDKLGISEKLRYYLPLDCTRFTKTAWEQMSFATAAGAELLTQPPTDLTDRPITITEMRGDSTEALIQAVLLRGQKAADSMSLNSCDPDKTGVRKLALKYKVDQPNVELICTNTADADSTAAEMTKSALVVSPTLVPGSGLGHKKRLRHDFQDVTRDSTSGRHRELDNPNAVAHFLAYTHMFAAYHCGLVNRMRSVPCEISQTVAAVMEWATFYLQNYADGVMDQTVRENFSRMVQGYTTRTLGWMVWLKTIKTLSRVKQFGSKKDDIVKNLLLDLHVDALPIVGVPVMLTCMMSRSVHMGSLLMVMLIARDMGVPVVSWGGLNDFFNADQPPREPGTLLDEYNMIRAWIGRCIEGRRFCPADEGDFDIHHNISCYITDEGRESMGPLHETTGFMRFAQSGGGHAQPPSGGGRGSQQQQHALPDEQVLFYKMANRILKLHGPHLFKQCHMGPERCVYMYAMMALATKFVPDFRGLGSPKTFHTEKHMRKMGFMGFLPGLKDHADDEPPPFARQVAFKERDQIKCVAFGVNPWSMLSIVALTGQILLHPSASDEFSMGLVTQILAKSPAGCTPGNICPTRFFSPNAQPVRMFIPSEDRPTHFLRPEDTGFCTTGVLTLAKGVEQFLPEDLLHCPAIPMVAKTLSCKIMQVPAVAVKVCVFFLMRHGTSTGLTRAPPEPVQPGAEPAILLDRASGRTRGGQAGHVWDAQRGHEHEEGGVLHVHQGGTRGHRHDVLGVRRVGGQSRAGPRSAHAHGGARRGVPAVGSGRGRVEARMPCALPRPRHPVQPPDAALPGAGGRGQHCDAGLLHGCAPMPAAGRNAHVPQDGRDRRRAVQPARTELGWQVAAHPSQRAEHVHAGAGQAVRERPVQEETLAGAERLRDLGDVSCQSLGRAAQAAVYRARG